MQINIPRDALVEAVERLSLDEFTAFLDEMLAIRAQRIAPGLSITEEELLQQIYSLQLSESESSLQKQLGAALEAETIGEAERLELERLTEKSERLNAERIAKVAELATLRQQPLREMMQQLGLWKTHATSER